MTADDDVDVDGKSERESSSSSAAAAVATAAEASSSRRTRPAADAVTAPSSSCLRRYATNVLRSAAVDYRRSRSRGRGRLDDNAKEQQEQQQEQQEQQEQQQQEQQQQDASSSSEEEEAYRRMEEWLGIAIAPSLSSRGTTTNWTTTAEDCAPFSEETYDAWCDLVAYAYRTGGGESDGDGDSGSGNDERTTTTTPAVALGATTPSLLLLESRSFLQGVDDDVDGILDRNLNLLELASGGARVTNWLYHLLDLNVSSSAAAADDDEGDDGDKQRQRQQRDDDDLSASSFIRGLLSPPSESGGGGGQRQHQRGLRVVKAAYGYVQQLPQLQAQIHRYTRRLTSTTTTTAAQQQRSSSSRDGGGSGGSSRSLKDPAGRLRQYERAQRIGRALQQEFDDHLKKLERLLGELYSAGNAQLRARQRKLLGVTWQRYVLVSSAATGSGGGSAAAAAAALSASGSSSSLRQENTHAVAVATTLRLLYRIVLGMKTNDATTTIGTTSDADEQQQTDTNKQQHRQRESQQQEAVAVQYDLLTRHLMPLHRPNALVLWRDQTSVLELYHEPLTKCIAALLQLHGAEDRLPFRKFFTTTIEKLCDKDVFPVAGHTPKQVLLLHELDSYLKLLTTQSAKKKIGSDDGCQRDVEEILQPNGDGGSTWFDSLLSILARCMSSEHSRVAERALEFFQNDVFCDLVRLRYDRASRTLLPALVRKGEPSWNPTVRKRTYLVLKRLQELGECGIDNGRFETICNELFSSSGRYRAEESQGPMSSAGAKSNSVGSRIDIGSSQSGTVPTDFSLKAGMAGWKPPSSLPQQHRRLHDGSMPPPPPQSGRMTGQRLQQQPPSTVTGVAPWASSVGASRASAPPVTVTGVAPWAAKQPQPQAYLSRAGRGTQHRFALPSASNKRRSAAEQGKNTDEEGRASTANGGDAVVTVTDGGYAFVEAYMEKLKPPKEDSEEGASSWSKAQMAETPTLLPDLKFHDLVFGHDLGAGAFGVVRYARLIDKTKTRSHWPEYAVKIISTEKIREYGYESSVQREIAVLRLLSHPGIARLVSSFRFKEGAYLVIEYASGGDLHGLLRKHGSLDHASARFVVGEIVAALASIHELGFVFSDLKTENVLITEPGHIKLTDFGACRPVTAKAKELLRDVSKNILRDLRDGSWESHKKKKVSEDATRSAAAVDSTWNDDDALENRNTEKDSEKEQEDSRIEGTTSYLPPEVVMGGIPTFAADTWALGCVAYQCLSGRPPFLEADDAATRHKIVSFEANEQLQEQPGSAVDRLFSDKHAADIEPSAREMIKSMLQRNASSRPTMAQVSELDFFEGTDVFQLHSRPAYPLDVGTVAPAPDAKWARRQFSSIWAPQPVEYDLSLPDAGNARVESNLDGSSSPIPEGGEVGSFFSFASAIEKPNLLPKRLGAITEG